MQLVNANKLPSRLEDLTIEGVKLCPTEPEDMWHVHNLVAIGDDLRAHTARKIKGEDLERKTSEIVHADITITVTAVSFDSAVNALHVNGRIVGHNEKLKMRDGQYHAVDLELNRNFVLWKKNGWDSVAVQTLRTALSHDRGDAIAAIVMDEGVAHICLVTNYQTHLIERVTRKSKAKNNKDDTNILNTKEEKTSRSYFAKVLVALERSGIDFSQPRPLLLASPGYVAARFKSFLAEEAFRMNDKQLAAVAKNAVKVHTSSGDLHALNDILKSREVHTLMSDRKSTSDNRTLDDLSARLRKDDGRAWYGEIPVAKAVAEGAVGRGGGVLLVNNLLFRNEDISIRSKYVALVDKVKEEGGEVRILSSDHQSGKRLEGMGNIAALLTYPMYDLDEDDDEDDLGRPVDGPTII